MSFVKGFNQKSERINIALKATTSNLKLPNEQLEPVSNTNAFFVKTIERQATFFSSTCLWKPR